MPSPSPTKPSGRILDPVFVFMLVAILLAVGTSFILRNAAANLGPSKAHGEMMPSYPPAHVPAKPHPATQTPAD